MGGWGGHEYNYIILISMAVLRKKNPLKTSPSERIDKSISSLKVDFTLSFQKLLPMLATNFGVRGRAKCTSHL